MDRQRYKEILSEFDAAGDHAASVSAALVGLAPAEPHRMYAEQIFVKLLAHCLTLRRLSPAPESSSQPELWDLSSNSVLARAAIEAFDALAYLALTPQEPALREFRLLLWELHDANRRAKMLGHIGSVDPRLADIQASSKQLYERAVRHKHFGSLSKSLQKRVHEQDPPSFMNSQRERCQANGIDHDYFNALTMQLSQYAHTSPFSVHQLFEFRAGSPDALRMMSLPVQFVLPFMLRATAGMRSLFPGITPDPSEGVSVSLAVWTEISSRGVKNAV
ncbi:MAG: hypothetical protein KF740_08995 [Ramlibacter sp.]|nr:hypothetical protein [Ramlibacter sp.]